MPSRLGAPCFCCNVLQSSCLLGLPVQQLVSQAYIPSLSLSTSYSSIDFENNKSSKNQIAERDNACGFAIMPTSLHRMCSERTIGIYHVDGFPVKFGGFDFIIRSLCRSYVDSIPEPIPWVTIESGPSVEPTRGIDTSIWRNLVTIVESPRRVQ